MDIKKVADLGRFLVVLLREHGELVHEIEGDRVLRFRGLLFGVCDKETSLSGPYGDLIDLLETEAVRLIPVGIEATDRLAQGARSVYCWRGRLHAFVVGVGFTVDDQETLRHELKGREGGHGAPLCARTAHAESELLA